MRVLHICNDFAGSTVHKCLYTELDNLGVEQLIYCPVRSNDLIGKNKFDCERSSIEYANIIKPYYKYLYHIKQRKLYNYLQKKYDLSKYHLCHASTLLSDGGIAYRIFLEYHVPYVVAVRSTDIDVFLKKAPNTWANARRILLNAQYIYFINKGLENNLVNHKVIKPIVELIKHKFVIQPNGVDNYYINHWQNNEHHGHGLVYVGDFTRRKNVLRLCHAVLELKEIQKYSDIKLTLVGGGKGRNGASEDVEETEIFVRQYPDVFNFVGPVFDKDKLCEIYNSNSIFAMPSLNETFGLVYIEALSQNLALLYTKEQGIDGLFDSKVGIAVNPMSIEEIKCAIVAMFDNRDFYSNSSINPESFQWSNIANTYLSHYKKILKN